MRDILLFPKFENESVIEDIRKECDQLYGIIKPHITIVFPFDDNMSDEAFIQKARYIVKEEKKFFVKFEGVSYSDDDYIFLNCVEGKESIIRLHDLLYDNLLKEYLLDKTYIPHITIGQKKIVRLILKFIIL